ncbi:hypothetical protein ONE63_008101 [Megalurothrips usitatus]|uniref:Ubiquitin-like protease family profile domain-containing protein n=1 Tax=Megalurothrips usitatus TaxID=439358 RepID=A0AAV7XXC1_9NEOP|nr:hypothetical protein ONE63_008101 [Megalurothrips usitatus]
MNRQKSQKSRGQNDVFALLYKGYGSCVFAKCRKFTFEVSKRGDEIAFDVYATEAVITHIGKKTTHLKGLEREEAKENLVSMSPGNFQRKCVDEAEPEVVLSGNTQKIRNDATTRTARREAVQRDHFHNDPVFDAMLHWKEGLETSSPTSLLVQDIGLPLHAYMFSDLQIETVRRFFKDPKECTVKFDATGRKVHALSYDPRKRVYLYSGVVKIRGIIFPVFEAIEVRHDQFTIGSFLEKFRGLSHKLHPTIWPIFGRLVTDYSPALIHAVMRALNDMRLIDYLRTIFNYVTGKYSSKDLNAIIILTLCRNHFIGMGTDTISEKCGKKSPHRKFLAECLCAMLQTQSLEEFTIVYKGFLTVTLSQYQTDAVTEGYRMITSRSAHVATEELKEDSQIEVDEDLFEADLKLLDSPFHTYCLEIYVSVKEQVEKNTASGKLNENFCPSYVTDVFLKRYSPILPLWTEILKNDRGYDFLSTNAEVEKYYEILDQDVMNHSPNVRLQKYIELVSGYISSTLKKLNLCVHTKPLKKSDKGKIPSLTVREKHSPADAEAQKVVSDDPGDNVNVEETWAKRTQNPHSHLHLSHTKSLLENLEKKSAPADGQQKVVQPANKEKKVPITKGDWREVISERFVAIVDGYEKLQEEGDPVLFLYGTLDRPLYLSSVMAVLNSNCLDTSLVDACMYILRKSHSSAGVYVASTDVSEVVFNSNGRDFEDVRMSLHGVNKVIFPLLQDAHWSLVVCDICECSMAVLNFSGDREELMERFLSFVDHCNVSEQPALDAVSWKLTEMPHVEPQCDKVNCGVYMLRFLRLILEEKALTNEFVILEERCHLAELCLQFKEGLQGVSCSLSEQFLLPNGLVNNIDYYNADLDEQFCILVREGHLPVFVEDFSKLMRNEWLSGNVIDALLLLHCIVRTDVVLLTSNDSMTMLDSRARLTKNMRIMTCTLKNKTIIMPYHANGNHWCLIIADCSAKQYTYLDPYHPSESTPTHLDKFVQFLRKRNAITSDQIVSSGWVPKVFGGLPRQEDNMNCGVLVCYYAVCVLQNVSSHNGIDCRRLRQDFACKLIQDAPFCKHLCVYCGKDEFKKNRSSKRVSEMVMCERCKRWAHMWPCLKYLKATAKVIRSETFDFVCKLCEVNGHLLL